MDVTLQDPLVGRLVDDRYQVESRIARGGMATVYLALDRRLDRDVALKVMHEDLAEDPEFVQRFVREARAAARLSHPNVVQVFDQGSDGGLLYLTMEYLPGRTLRDVLAQRGSLTPREALSVMEPLLDALSAAHRAGIVHRDVKPENVVLTDDGRIKVADFGLARAASRSATSATGTGTLLGTVAYLAPELVTDRTADARADVYAAGIVFFEMLTGRQPFTGDDPLAVAHRHVRERVPAPSQVAAQLPQALDTVVLAATAHAPDQRPGSAEEMLALLRHARQQVPPEQLDVRVVQPVTQVLATGDRTRVVPAAAQHQQTRVFAVDAPPPVRSAPPGRPPLVPQLRVNDDDDLPPRIRRTGALAAGGRRVGLVAAAAIVLAVLGTVWYAFAGPGAYVTAPPLVGDTVAEAEAALRAQGLSAEVVEVFSSRVPAGQVVSADPGAGERVPKNGTVTLSVSKGPEVQAVPGVAGKTVEDATKLLEQAGFTVGETQERFDGSVPAGLVIASSPVQGQKVAPGATIGLVVSKGVELVPLPDVTGKQIAEAQKALEDLGLEVRREPIDPYWFGPSAGTVTDQNPDAGAQLKPGDTVRLTFIREDAQPGQPGTQPTDPNAQVPVPGVVGQRFQDAERALREAGFDVRREGTRRNDGLVVAQSVSGTAPRGSTVVVTVV